MEFLDFAQIKLHPEVIDSFGSREMVPLSCSGCSTHIMKMKKYILSSLKKGKKGFFCSPKCSGQHYSQDKVFYVCCQVCGKNVRRTTSSLLKNVFCSSSCAAKYNNLGKQRNKAKTRTCKQCDCAFFTVQGHDNVTFCSECFFERRKIPRCTTNIKKQYNCTKCGEEYMLRICHKSKLFCEKCKNTRVSSRVQASSEQIKASTLSDYISRTSIKNKHPSWRFSHVRVFNRSWNKNLTKLPCQVCGYNKHVELAHIKAVSNFPDSATLGEVNSPDNMLVLCRNHHWELDHGHITIEQIPPRMSKTD